jgi:formylglycine-generating enzyme required for sulfatase activity
MHTGEPDEAPRQTPAAEISWVETEQLLEDFAKRNPSLGQGEVAAAVQREELLTRSGLLQPRPNEHAAFYHLSFQEFLAAQRLGRRGERRVTEAIESRCAVPEWRPTLLFLFAAQVLQMDPEWGLDLLREQLQRQDRAAVKSNPSPAAFIAEALELCLAKRYQIPEVLAESFRRLSLDAIEDEVELQARQTLGLCLGWLGDPRIVDLRDPRAYVEVPAGTYPYGEEGETVEIAATFWIGRYPVTNSQYQAFIEGGGYDDREWWSDAGWAWLQKAGVKAPRYWRYRRWSGPNQPVVGVSFWEAEACCAWAGGRLPQPPEWEAAARGPEGGAYPWGDEWENGICNTSEAGLGVTSPVGLFPRCRQAQLGIEDLAGNISEWCAGPFLGEGGPIVDLNTYVEIVGGVSFLEARGGSWYWAHDRARCGKPLGFQPERRDDLEGFRVVFGPPSKVYCRW